MQNKEVIVVLYAMSIIKLGKGSEKLPQPHPHHIKWIIERHLTTVTRAKRRSQEQERSEHSHQRFWNKLSTLLRTITCHAQQQKWKTTNCSRKAKEPGNTQIFVNTYPSRLSHKGDTRIEENWSTNDIGSWRRGCWPKSTLEKPAPAKAETQKVVLNDVHRLCYWRVQLSLKSVNRPNENSIERIETGK